MLAPWHLHNLLQVLQALKYTQSSVLGSFSRITDTLQRVLNQGTFLIDLRLIASLETQSPSIIGFPQLSQDWPTQTNSPRPSTIRLFFSCIRERRNGETAGRGMTTQRPPTVSLSIPIYFR